MKNILFTILLVLSGWPLYQLNAQELSLKEKLAGKERVEDIMEIVEAHYAEIKSRKREYANEGSYKHWMRWGHYMSSRTDVQGRLVDVTTMTRDAFYSYDLSSQRSSTGNWVFRGPHSISGTWGSAAGIGRVDRVAFDPTDANIVYIGTPSGGLFKSINGGTTWTPLTDNIPSISVSGIVVSHTDPSDVYILTGDGDSSNGGLVVGSGFWRASAGVFVSHDGGTNWDQTSPLPIDVPYAGYNLAQNPVNPGVLLAATTEGLYRTSNAGGSWTEVLTGRTFEVKFKPGSSTIAYATQDGEFWRSNDGGLTWTEIVDFDFPLPSGRVAMAVSQNFPAYVYLLSGNAPSSTVDSCGEDPNMTFGGVFLSSDSGVSFDRRCNSPNLVESCCAGVNSRSQSNYDLAIAASHSNFLNLLSAGLLAWRSQNGGLTWSNAMGEECDDESFSTGFVHVDVHDIEYNPLNGHVYLCCDGGIVKSTNNGIDWINISDGVAASEAYHMAGTPVDIDNMMIGLQDNGVKRRNANTNVWDPFAGGDGYDCIYNVGSATEGLYSTNGRVGRFWNNGGDAVGITPIEDEFFWRVTSHVTDPTIVLAGCNDIYKSVNNGVSWTNKGASGYWDIERCPSNQFRFYAAGGNSAFSTTGSMYFSANAGDTWDIISDSPGYPSGSIRMTDIDVRPNNSTNVWIVFGGFSAGNKVFYSDSTGASWENMSGSLPNIPINAIQVDASNNVYIGTDLGVFYRGASMDDWVPFWHRLPIIPVSDLELYESAGIIRASTFGRGVWESDTYSTCNIGLNLTANLSGNRYYETSDTISCSSLIFGGANTRLVLKSNDYVILKIGFESLNGNTVHAYIAPCGTAQNED